MFLIIVKSPERILVAEDDPQDAFFLKREFARAGVPTSLHFVQDGQEVIDYLEGKGAFADRQTHPMPNLVLLDLKMPRLNGFDVLGWLRKQTGLKRLPVIIFSSSAESVDINRAYDLGANSYLVKPHEIEALSGLVNCLKTYWLEANSTPDFSP